MSEPTIAVTECDVEKVQKLLNSESTRTLPGIDLLLNELNWATVVKTEEVGPDVVTMNSTVRFVEEESNKPYELKLVHPSPGSIALPNSA